MPNIPYISKIYYLNLKTEA